MLFQVFKSDEFRIGLGASVYTAAVQKANADAANWINQYGHQIEVKHISTGMTQVFAYVTVWYEMKDGGSAP